MLRFISSLARHAMTCNTSTVDLRGTGTIEKGWNKCALYYLLCTTLSLIPIHPSIQRSVFLLPSRSSHASKQGIRCFQERNRSSCRDRGKERNELSNVPRSTLTFSFHESQRIQKIFQQLHAMFHCGR
jgi:hypothetical protein